MRVLIYGAGVIGCYLAHVLNQACENVTLLCRGDWKKTIESTGLVIEHYLQRKRTVDRMPVVSDASGNYDIIFVTMQYTQMRAVLDDVAKSTAKYIVLVGNNMSCQEMKSTIEAHASEPKTVLFAFSGTGGRRENGVLHSIHVGHGDLVIGPCEGDVHLETKRAINALFADTKYKITWTPDMYAWCRCHLAMILPIAYLAYQANCNLRKTTLEQRRRCINAVFEGYQMLKSLGTPETVVNDGEWFRPGSKKRVYMMTPLMHLVFSTKLGELAATDHCKNAIEEMHALSDAWDELRKAVPQVKMPNWDRLKSDMPDWSSLALRP